MQIYAIVGCNHSLPLWALVGGVRGIEGVLTAHLSPAHLSPLTVYLLFHQGKIKA